MANLAVTAEKFWHDESVELNHERLKKEIPTLPTLGRSFQTVKGGGVETLAYLIQQVIKSDDKHVIMRALASAAAWLMEDAKNFTGSKSPPVDLTGLAAAADPTIDPNTILKTNFEDAEDVTVKEILDTMAADSDELGALIGIYFVAGNKRVTSQNRSAFNERRRQAATASIIGDPVVFITDSIYLTDAVLTNIYASFLSCAPLRMHMTTHVIQHLDATQMGPALAFVNMFLLLVDIGMSALRIIKEAVLKNQWIRVDFPELKPELAAANEAQQCIKRAAGRDRSFLKAIFGNAFVPVNYAEIDNLLGVCKEILKRTTPSYQNYGGGKVTESQMQRINAKTAAYGPVETAETPAAE